MSDDAGLRRGQGWVAISPFTPQERWVTEEEYRRLVLAGEVTEPAPGSGLVVTNIDYENKVVTFGSAPREDKA